MESLQDIISRRVAFGAWCVFEDELTDEARCKRAVDMGLDYGFAEIKPENYQKILPVCEKAGMRIMGFVPAVQHMPADHYARVGSAIENYVTSPAFAGCAIRDEPGVYDFPRLKLLLDAHRKAAPDKIGLINLFPMYASDEQMNGVDYETYIRRFSEEVDDQILSYDFYPLYGQKQAGTWVQDNYLRNFEIVARQAQKKNAQMWYFIQTFSFNHIVRDVKIEDLRFQIFCALSFGARAIQLFTYGTPANGDEYFEDSIIDRDGNATFRYEDNKKIIAEFNGWTEKYVPYKWVGAMTSGKDKDTMQREFDVVFPGNIVHHRTLQGTYMDLDHPLHAFAPVTKWEGDTPLLMGCFEKKDGCAFTLVNMTDPAAGRASHAKITFAGPVTLRVSGKKETYTVQCDGEWNITLENGEGLFAEIIG